MLSVFLTDRIKHEFRQRNKVMGIDHKFRKLKCQWAHHISRRMITFEVNGLLSKGSVGNPEAKWGVDLRNMAS